MLLDSMLKTLHMRRFNKHLEERITQGFSKLQSSTAQTSLNLDFART